MIKNYMTCPHRFSNVLSQPGHLELKQAIETVPGGEDVDPEVNGTFHRALGRLAYVVLLFFGSADKLFSPK